MSIALGKVLDRSGYLQDLRDERSEEAEGRIENLMELVSAAREYESRESRAVARRLRRSAVAAVGRRRGSRRQERPRAHDDDAQRQGPGVSDRHHRRPGGRALPALAVAAMTKPSSRRSGVSVTSAITRAQRRLVLTSAARRRVFGDYQSTEPSRFIDEIPAELIEEVPSAFALSS